LNFNVHDAVIELILVGVVRFIGGTPQEGHYFAVVKDFEDLSCWLCDDNKVSKTTENVLLGECAGNPVLLFYIRKEVLESERTHTWQSSPNISIQKRSSDRLRQRARRKENSKEAAQMLTNRYHLEASSPWSPETSANYHQLEANTSTSNQDSITTRVPKATTCGAPLPVTS
jgi:hypothetical protein